MPTNVAVHISAIPRQYNLLSIKLLKVTGSFTWFRQHSESTYLHGNIRITSQLR